MYEFMLQNVLIKNTSSLDEIVIVRIAKKQQKDIQNE